MFLFLFLGRHSQSLQSSLRQIQPHYLFSPSLQKGMANGLVLGPKCNIFTIPVLFTFVSVMSSSQSVHNIYCNLPSDIHQLWHLYFQISVVLVNKPISWYFSSKFRVLKFSIHKIKVIYLESFSKTFFFWWTSILRQCYILTAIIEQFILIRFEKFYLNVLPFFSLSKIFSKFKH